MIPNHFAFPLIPADVQAQNPPRLKRKLAKMSVSSTNQAFASIFECYPNLTMMHIIALIRNNELGFGTCEGSKYNTENLIFGRLKANKQNKELSSIVYSRLISDSEEFLEIPFGNKVAHQIVNLSREFARPYIQELMRIGFPLNNNLQKCIEEAHQKFTDDSQKPCFIEYGIGRNNYNHALNLLLKSQPTLHPTDAPLHFIGHPFWQECLLRISVEDQAYPIQKTDAGYLAVFLWGTRQYPKWHSAISKKMWMLKQISPNEDLYRINAWPLFKLSLRQPINEITTTSPKTLAQEAPKGAPKPKRRKIGS